MVLCPVELQTTHAYINVKIDIPKQIIHNILSIIALVSDLCEIFIVLANVLFLNVVL